MVRSLKIRMVIISGHNHMAVLYDANQGGLAIGFVVCVRLSGLRWGFHVGKSTLELDFYWNKGFRW